MKKFIAAILFCVSFAAYSQEKDIVSTDAYRWCADTIIQGQFRAWAPDPHRIVSTYSAQPHYYMPVSGEWNLRNDISAYPRLKGAGRLHEAVYNMALDEMVNAVEPDTTLRTGKEWGGVWTRDVSYSIILSMSYMQPLASEVSLRRKVNAAGRIVQDTGSGGAWPVSSDRMIWAVAAYELYKVTGSREWLEFAYPVIRDSMEDDLRVTHVDGGLVKGETSFIDWREQSYPRWMQTADICQSEALGTSVIHAMALDVLAEMASELGLKAESKGYAERSAKLAEAIDRQMWMEDRGYYAMYRYGRDHLILNPRAETLGESLSILYDIAPAARQRTITESNPTTPYGAAIFYPQIADMPAYHNNALWPWVASMWALANAKAGNEQGTLEAIGSVFRPAALFCTNKENFNLDNGDIATELNSSNMLWCLAGNIALTHRILFGIHFEKDGLAFRPFVPKALDGVRTLEGFRYRGATLNIKVSGYGDSIASFKLNGRSCPPKLPTRLRGVNEVEIVMCSRDIAPMKVNHVRNLKAPLTPIARLATDYAPDGGACCVFTWNPIEYIDHYVVLRDGVRIASTRQTSCPADVRGEYQVIGVAPDGTESFASEPVHNGEVIVAEMQGEVRNAVSPEISYLPQDAIEGYHGEGFVETDHEHGTVSVSVEIPEEGDYALSFVYANGNGPVNTENKCAVRTLIVDGVRAGVIVMPHRGDGKWDDWGASSSVRVHLAPGRHEVVLELRPENENMNLATNHALVDRVVLRRVNG